MKAPLTFFSLVLFSLNTFATTELTCWNIYSKSGSRPILKAKIEGENTLYDVSFNLKDELFASYFVDSSIIGYPGTELENTDVSKGHLENPMGYITPEEIISNKSPYKGNNEYAIELGIETVQVFKKNEDKPFYEDQYTYSGRLILPQDLSKENLKTVQLRNWDKRVNGLFIYKPSRAQSQSGDNYLKLHCTSNR